MTARRVSWLGLVAVLLAGLGLPVAAAAQAGATFSEVARRLDPGDAVVVDDHDGARHAGTVVSVSPDALVITGPAGPESFTPAATARVAARGDSLVNGGLVGFLPAFLLGVQLPHAVSEQRVNEGSGLKAGLITGLIGAAIGMAVDGAREGETELYTAAPPARVAVAPVLSRHAVGVAAAVRW